METVRIFENLAVFRNFRIVRDCANFRWLCDSNEKKH